MSTVSSRKINRAFESANIPAMPQTRTRIWRNVTNAVPAAVLDTMTAAQIGACIAAAHRSYHDAKAANGAQVADDCIWVGRGVDKLIPLAALSALQAHRSTETISGVNWYTTHYSLDYTERC